MNANILLVEDDHVYCDMLRMGLEKSKPSFNVTAVFNLAQAAESLNLARFDAILLDLGLPEAEGLDTLAEMLRLCQDTPVIVLTGDGDDQLGDAAISAGAQDYLIKGESDLRLTARALRYAISRRAADEALRASEKNYRDLFENAPLGIFQSLPEGRFTYVNRHMATMHGYESPQEMIASITDIAGQLYDKPERRALEYEKMMRSGGPYRFEAVFKRKNGSFIQVGVIFRPLIDKAGHLTRVDGFVEDITRRKRAEEAQLTRLKYEKALSACSKALLTTVGESGAVTTALRHLREAAGARRIYLYANAEDQQSGLSAQLIHEDNEPGLPSLGDTPEIRSLYYSEGLIRWRDELSLGYPIVGPAHLFPDYEQNSPLVRQSASVLILPVQAQGKWYGFIGLEGDNPKRAWSQSDIFLLQTGGEIIGAYLERKRVEDLLRLAEKKYRNIFEQASEGIFQSSPQGRFLDVNPALAKILGYESPLALLADTTDIKTMLDDPQQDPGNLFATLQASGFVRNCQARMIRKDGSRVWVEISAQVIHDQAGQIARIEGLLSDITERKLREDELDRKATQDPLTDIPNRYLFEDRLNVTLNRATRYGQTFGVIFIDLDKFKEINDAYGHQAGDTVLKATAGRIQNQLRKSDTVARLGGDEFCVIVDNIKDKSTIRNIARSILEAVRRPIDLGVAEPLSVTASLGFSFFPLDGDSVESLLHKADSSMYAVKKNGGNDVSVQL